MKKSNMILALSIGASLGMTSTSVYSSELFISEYVEGSSLNKALELYNPTSESIDLSNYQLKIYFNGRTSVGKTISLNGSLAPQTTYVVASSDGHSDLTSRADQLVGGGWFNGDDAITLIKGAVVVDRIGQLGTDPGSSWGSGDTSTKNHTLRRKTSISEGETDPSSSFEPSDQWLGFAIDTFDGLGAHDGGGTTPPPPPPSDACGDAYLKISAVQGSGLVSPLVNQQVTVEAGVTADHQAGLKGIFIQSLNSDDDNNPATSEGIFLYTASSPLSVNIGDHIRVSAKVAEYYDTTQLGNITASQICATGITLPDSTLVSLPVTAMDDGAFRAKFNGQ